MIMKMEYIAPEVSLEGNLRCIICAGSGDASYGVGIEEITTGDEISFD